MVDPDRGALGAARATVATDLWVAAGAVFVLVRITRFAPSGGPRPLAERPRGLGRRPGSGAARLLPKTQIRLLGLAPPPCPSFLPMRVGLDYCSALVNREGIGRYTREVVRGLVGHGFGGNLGLFGYTLAGRRFGSRSLGLKDSRVSLCRLRMPSRWIPGLLRRLGKGVDDLVGAATSTTTRSRTP